MCYVHRRNRWTFLNLAILSALALLAVAFPQPASAAEIFADNFERPPGTGPGTWAGPPKYMVPEEIAFLAELPKTSTGKINRLELRKVFEHNATGRKHRDV